MNQSTLLRLAEEGLGALSEDDLPGLISYCWDHSENTGDARFALIARTLEPVRRVLDEDDERGGVDPDLIDSLDALFRRELAAVLMEPLPADACLLGRPLRAEVWRLVSGYEDRRDR